MYEADNRYAVWTRDAEVLAAMGRSFFTQRTLISVRIPRALAEQAVVAWKRPEDDAPLLGETSEQQTVRQRARALGLIGLSTLKSGSWAGDEVVVSLDAWYIGDALRAAEAAGMLDGLSPPNH